MRENIVTTMFQQSKALNMYMRNSARVNETAIWVKPAVLNVYGGFVISNLSAAH